MGTYIHHRARSIFRSSTSPILTNERIPSSWPLTLIDLSLSPSLPQQGKSEHRLVFSPGLYRERIPLLSRYRAYRWFSACRKCFLLSTEGRIRIAWLAQTTRVRSPIPEATRINGGHCKRVSETWPVTPPRGGTHTFQDFSLLMGEEGREEDPHRQEFE